MPRNRTRIVVVDDHPAIREALASRIQRQDDLDVCGEAGDVEQAQQMIEDLVPDLVVVDLSLKTRSGLDLVQWVRSTRPSTKIVVWSMYDPEVYADRLIRAGADAYVSKEESTEGMIAAIKRVLSGAGDQRARPVAPTADADPLASRVKQLSNRELQVFQYLGQGLDMNEISERMQLSVKTVETYRARLKKKLDAPTRLGLVRIAFEWNMRQPSFPLSTARPSNAVDSLS